MIISTRTSDAILRKAFGRKSASIIGFDKMIEQFAIDPTMAQPPRECFVVTNEDIVSNRHKAQFEQAAANKHPNVKIIFINKGKKPFYPDATPIGIDIVYNTSPNPEKLTEDISNLISGNITETQDVEIGAIQIDKNAKNNIPDIDKEGFKLSRQRAKKPVKKGLGTLKSVTGQPVQAVEGTAIFITRATDQKGKPIEPPIYLAVDNNGKYHPIYPDGTPIETDESGNILDPAIAVNDNGEPLFDENNIVVMMNPEDIPEQPITPEDILTNNVNNLQTYDQVEQAAEEKQLDNPDVPEIPEPVPQTSTPVPSSDMKSNIMNRIESTNKISDLSLLTQQMTSSEVIKDLINTNSTYAGIEEKLRAIQESIYVIMNDRSYTTMEDRYNAVMAKMHDKAFFNANGNTLIEQLTIQIVETIVSKSTELVNTRVAEIDKAIKAYAERGVQDQPARLAGLANERADIITNLYSIDKEIKEIARSTDGLLADAGNTIVNNLGTNTGDEDVDLWFEARGAAITDEASLTALQSLLAKSVELPDKFQDLTLKIKTEQAILRKLLNVEQEMIEAQQQVINRMKTRGVDGAVIAQTALKKAMNIFVGSDNTGKTIIPYLFARYKSKQNAHVLLVNICRNNKFGTYGIKTINYDDFITNIPLQDFTVVTGLISDDVTAGQGFITALLKAADYYKYIYVVMDDDQSNLFNVVAPDVFSINYIVDTNPGHLDRTKEFIDKVNLENVAQRIFINRCNINIRPILARLGKLDSIDYQICKVQEIPEITDGSLSTFDPYGISSVTFEFEELHRHVKP